MAKRRVEFLGASGATYSFLRLEPGEGLRSVGALWVIAAPGGTGWRILEAGETANLAAGQWRSALDAGKLAEPSAECLVRLSISRKIRDGELHDIWPPSRG